MFSFTIPIIAWVLLGIMLLFALIALSFAMQPLKCTGEYNPEAAGTQQPEATENFPLASIIIYSSQPEEELLDSIDNLLMQDYPNFELVVVYDATAETTKNFEPMLEERKNRVRLTFIPPGSRNLSRLKLALTLGMKAAAGEVAVLTSVNAQIPSSRWLSDIMVNIIGEKQADIVLGYSHLDYNEIRGITKWYKQFDSVMSGAQWVGAALAGKPFRGDRHNLAFRRNLFFLNKGYASSMFLQNGDDDLFVNEICRGNRTAMMITPATILTMHWGEAANRVAIDLKERHLFTRKWLPSGPFLRSGLLSACQWICLGTASASAIIGFPSLIPLIFAAVFMILFWLGEISIYRKAAENLRATRLWWAVPLFMLIRPIANTFFRMAVHSRKQKNYTWQHKRN